MSRYIDADEAIRNIDQLLTRYIDADEVIRYIGQLHGLGITDDVKNYVRYQLMSMTTANVVPVVRCKDCRFYDPEWKFCQHQMTERSPDYYCASGRNKG